MKHTTIEEQLEKDGFVLELSVGTSMEPLLKQRQEQLLIKKAVPPFKNNQIVLYKRASGQYLLHRIVKVNCDNYITRGDNRFGNERIYENQIIGVLSGFYKGKKFIDCEKNFLYKLYVFIWRLTYPIRLLLHKITGLFKRVLSKLKVWANERNK